MPETFTFEEASKPSEAFSFEEAKAPETFSFEDAQAPSDSGLQIDPNSPGMGELVPGPNGGFVPQSRLEAESRQAAAGLNPTYPEPLPWQKAGAWLGKKLSVTPKELADAMSELDRGGALASGAPEIMPEDVPAGEPSRPPTLAEQRAAGVISGINKTTANLVSDPVNLALLGTGAGPVRALLGEAGPLISRGANAAFTGMGIAGAGETGRELGRVSVEGTPEEKAEAATGAALGTAFTADMARGAAKPGLRAEMRAADEIREGVIDRVAKGAVPPEQAVQVLSKLPTGESGREAGQRMVEEGKLSPVELLAKREREAQAPRITKDLLEAERFTVPDKAAELSPDALKDLEASLRGNQLKPEPETVQTPPREVAATTAEAQPLPEPSGVEAAERVPAPSEGETVALPDSGRGQPAETAGARPVEPVRFDLEEAYAPELARPEELRRMEAEGGPVAESDRVLNFLDETIAKLEHKPGELLEGVTGAPVWLTKEAARGVLQVVRAGYKSGKAVVEAIRDGIEHLRGLKLPGFEESAARDWLHQEMRSGVVDELDALEEDRFRAKKAGNTRELRKVGARIKELKADLDALRKPAVAESATPMPEPEAELAPTDSPEKPPEELPVEPEEGARPVPEAPSERVAELRRQLEDASRDLREKISARHDAKTKEDRAAASQAANLAAARFRELEAALENNPEHVRQLLLDELHAPDDFIREDIRAKLGRLKAPLINRVHEELVKEGKLKGPGTIQTRTMGDFNAKLKEMQVDSPTRPLLDRLKLADRVAAQWAEGKDAITKSRAKLRAYWQVALGMWKNLPKEDDFRRATQEWKAEDEHTRQETLQFVREIKRLVPDGLRRQAITVWLDAGGKESVLRDQLEQLEGSGKKRFAPVWRAALELTHSEKELAGRIRDELDNKLDTAMTAGILDRGRVDYGAPQVWKRPPDVPESDAAFAEGSQRKGKPGNPRAILDPRNPFFGFQRTVPNYFEGIMANGEPASLSIGDLVAYYEEAMQKNISSRGVIFRLKNSVAADGLPVVKVSGSAVPVKGEAGTTYLVDSNTHNKSDVSADGRPYRSVDSWAMRDWALRMKDAEGNPILVRGDMKIHPDHYQALKNMLSESALRKDWWGAILRPIFRLNSLAKATKLSLPLFHLSHIGLHSIFHRVSPLNGDFEIDLKNPEQALLVRHGLELGASGYREMFEDQLAGHGGLFAKVPGLGDALGKFGDWFWKKWIPELTMRMGLKFMERNRAWYGHELSEAELAGLSAREANAAAGVVNFREIARNATFQDILRIGLLAPQFGEARLRILGQALRPYGRETQLMLAFQAASLYMAARVLNYMLSDDHEGHFEPENALRVVVKGRSYGMRTLMGDAMHLAEDRKSFAAGRVSPFAKMAYELWTQKDLRTGAVKDPPVPTDSKSLRTAENAIMGALEWTAPVGSEGFLPGAAKREQSPTSSVLQSFGVTSRKYSAVTQIADLAEHWNRNSDDKATREYQKDRDDAVHKPSDYRGLNALLDAGRTEEAQQEIRNLMREGHKFQQIQTYFNRVKVPFTGAALREKQFIASLNAEQRKTYGAAMDERYRRMQAFNRASAGLPASDKK